MIFKDIDIGTRIIKIPHLYNLEQSLNLLDYELGRAWFRDFKKGFNRIQSILCGVKVYDLFVFYNDFKKTNPTSGWNTGSNPIRLSKRLKPDHIRITLEKPSTNPMSDCQAVELELRIIEI